MSDNHPATLSIKALLAECQFERTRRGGPGGQHRNKVESAIVVTHVPTNVSGQASERRSQHANRDIAIERLRVNLALTVRREINADAIVPSERWQTRCRAGRIGVSVRHEDFAALLAEALDVLSANKFSLPTAAELLTVSSSQLIKVLKLEPAAMQQLNENREKLGLRRLK